MTDDYIKKADVIGLIEESIFAEHISPMARLYQLRYNVAKLPGEHINQLHSDQSNAKMNCGNLSP